MKYCTPWPLVRKQTIPTDRPPLVGEIQCQPLWIEGCRVVRAADPHTVVNLSFLDGIMKYYNIIFVKFQRKQPLSESLSLVIFLKVLPIWSFHKYEWTQNFFKPPGLSWSSSGIIFNKNFLLMSGNTNSFKSHQILEIFLKNYCQYKLPSPVPPWISQEFPRNELPIRMFFTL
jgi:hypothetical protein